MGSILLPQACLDCRHFKGYKADDLDDGDERLHCAAFPLRIPNSVVNGDNLHREPIRGDNGIQYSKINGETTDDQG